MEQREEIEMLFWDVIDGHAADTERARAEALLASSAAYRTLYRELEELHQAALGTDPEHPSLRFNRNVMDVIARTEPARPVKKYYNPWVLGALGLLFALLIGAQLVPVLMDSSKNQSRSTPLLSSPDWIHLRDWIAASSGFALFIIVPVGLLLLDALLKRRRMTEKTGS